MHDNFEDHDDSIEYEIEVETDADVHAIPDEGLVLAGTDQGYLGIIGAMLSGVSIANRYGLR